MSYLQRPKASSNLRFAILAVVAWLFAIIMSTKDALPSIRASYRLLERVDIWEPAKDLEESIERQRQIQAHYLSYGVYIQLDDIVIGALDTTSQPKANPLVCGEGSTALWVPVAFHFPVFGKKVFEWCLERT